MGINVERPTEDLGASLERAARLARRGDTDGLEVELSHMRRLSSLTALSVAGRLRHLARAVRAHPSFSDAAQARAV